MEAEVELLTSREESVGAALEGFISLIRFTKSELKYIFYCGKRHL